MVILELADCSEPRTFTNKACVGIQRNQQTNSMMTENAHVVNERPWPRTNVNATNALWTAGVNHFDVQLWDVKPYLQKDGGVSEYISDFHLAMKKGKVGQHTPRTSGHIYFLESELRTNEFSEEECTKIQTIIHALAVSNGTKGQRQKVNEAMK